jgi:hypothetical protein
MTKFSTVRGVKSDRPFGDFCTAVEKSVQNPLGETPGSPGIAAFVGNLAAPSPQQRYSLHGESL